MTIKVNDRVTFKVNGTEEYGKVLEIAGGIATIRMWDSRTGTYYQTRQPVSRCSKD